MTVTLKDIKGLGPVSINDLGMHGIWSVEDLANASIADIRRAPGFGAARAAQVQQAAADLLGSGAAATSPAPKRARSAKKPTPNPTSPKQVQDKAPEVLAAAENRVPEESGVLTEQDAKGKKSKEKKSTKGKKKGQGKKKDKKQKDKKKKKDKKK